MATTLQNLIDDCEADLGDSGNATWAAADIEQWCRDAIADYSLHFPRLLIQDVSTSAGDRAYDLNANFIVTLAVEYPQGEDPPQYLERLPHTHPRFWHEDGFYDIIARKDDSDADEIWIGKEPTDSETIRVLYHGQHDFTIVAGGNLTVTEYHHHILRNYVLWRAAIQLKAIEEANPTSNSSLLMSQYAVNVDRARRAYVDALAKAVYTQSEGGPVSWKDKTNETTRIY